MSGATATVVNSGRPRVGWIDIAKGIAIILMVIGHTPGISPYLRLVIFSFHMPFFMLINGYLIRNYNPGQTFRRSLKTLILPYVYICLLEAFFSMLTAPDLDQAGTLLFNGFDDMVVGMSKTSTVFTRYGSVWLVWFVVCLFFARNIYVLLMHFTQKLPVWIRWGLILLISFTGYLLGTFYGFLPWSLDVALYSVVFIAAGDFLRKSHYFEKWNIWKVIIPFIIWAGFSLTGKHIELAMRLYPYVFGGAVCAVAGSIFMIWGSIFMDKRMRFLSSIVMWYGRHSLLILGIHTLEMRFINWASIGGTLFGIHWAVEGIVRFGFISLCTLLVLKIQGVYKHWNDRINESDRRIEIKGTEKSRGTEDVSAMSAGMVSSDESAMKTRVIPSDDSAMKTRSVSGSSRRLAWPDIAKGICILAVIAGHMGIGFINQLVFLWHLPVFFLLAGYFLKVRPFGAMLKDKARRLLVPYYLTCMAICLIAGLLAMVKGTSVAESVIPWAKAALYAAGDNWTTPVEIKGIGAIWFLWALFIAIMITNHFIERRMGFIIIIAVAVAGWASFTYTGVWLPLSIQAGMLCSLYLLIGYLARKRALVPDSFHPLLLTGAGIIAALGIQHFKGFWLVHDYMGNGWIDFLFSIAASIMVIAFSSHISHESPLFTRLLIFYGRNSLLILCLHIIDLDVLPIQGIVPSICSRIHISLNELMMMGLVYMTKIAYVTIGLAVLNKLKIIVCKFLA